MSDATRAKICGLTNAEDLAVSIGAGADAVGFVVGVPVDSPREISPERARELAEAVPPFVTSVVVTMPETPENARSLVGEVRPDALQVHGADPETIAAIGTAVDPFAVDVASGVERRGGRKDHDAVREFIARAAGTRTRSERTVEP